MSAKHIRLYTVVYDKSAATEVGTLVYAEDLSRNGTYWNRSLIGRGNGGFLLSTDDVLKLSGSVSLRFKPAEIPITEDSHFDNVQEMEMEVCIFVRLRRFMADKEYRNLVAATSSPTGY